MQQTTLVSTWGNLDSEDNRSSVITNKTTKWCKIQNRQASYFNHSSKMYMAVQYIFHHTFISTISTQQQETWIYPFFQQYRHHHQLFYSEAVWGGWGLQLYLKRDSGTGVLPWILQKILRTTFFIEHLLWLLRFIKILNLLKNQNTKGVFNYLSCTRQAKVK